MDLLCKVETVVGEVYWRWSVFSQLVAAMHAVGLNVRFVTISIASLQTVERPLLGGSLEVLLIEPECLHVRFSIVLIDVMVGDCPDGEVIERLWAYLRRYSKM